MSSGKRRRQRQNRQGKALKTREVKSAALFKLNASQGFIDNGGQVKGNEPALSPERTSEGDAARAGPSAQAG
ncbi:MAG TPA: hypothetical protein DCR11_10975 [Deltaproteobacteria bacterium]|nr:hypothetical protein [Deltaproteobacteria bacterium]